MQLILQSTGARFALMTAAISGVSAFVNKLAVKVAGSPIAFSGTKNAIVAMFLVGAILLLGRWREVRDLNRKQWVKLISIGVVGGSLPFALFFTGLAQTSAVNAAIIHKTLFIWVALLAIPLLRERLTKWQWVGAGAIFSANLIIGGFSGFVFSQAELFILLATMLWAVENIIAKRVLAEVSSLTVAAARMVFGSALLVGYLVTFGGGYVVPITNAAELGWMMLTALFLFGYVTTWYTALKHAPATFVAILLIPAALVTNILSAIFITHAFSFQQFAQAGLFVLGTALVIGFAQRQPIAPSVATSLE